MKSTTTGALSFELGGSTMPAIGFGTFTIPDEDVEQVVLKALNVGYRHVDTAEFYQNEGGVGRGIAASGIPREELFITTKLRPGNPNFGEQVKGYDATIDSCKQSVAKLGLSPDLYLIHNPFSGKEARLEQYKGVLECQRLGLCRLIGVSNYSIEHLKEIEAAGLPLPAANQLELHPMCQKPPLLAFMRERRILPIAYSSLAPLASFREGYTAFTGSRVGQATPELVGAIAGRLGVSDARVLLRYALQKGWCVLPKSTREARMAENFDLASFTLAEADMAQLDAMECDAAVAFGAPGKAFDPTTVP